MLNTFLTWKHIEHTSQKNYEIQDIDIISRKP